MIDESDTSISNPSAVIAGKSSVLVTVFILEISFSHEPNSIVSKTMNEKNVTSQIRNLFNFLNCI
ncbi:hypothetical protein AQPE_3075 [Aquipluma nitroreducens]|uniref:Uncharacterized protein n=1 Tax=Aquipluma nitroreducens TaxID=2010828 RepID=A0A5K7SBN8_9BACT|nr:hypothetical protein AQPE_3075 [Aquipluma nitroreducens]